jgi:hypothetical protein
MTSCIDSRTHLLDFPRFHYPSRGSFRPKFDPLAAGLVCSRQMPRKGFPINQWHDRRTLRGSSSNGLEHPLPTHFFERDYRGGNARRVREREKRGISSRHANPPGHPPAAAAVAGFLRSCCRPARMTCSRQPYVWPVVDTILNSDQRILNETFIQHGHGSPAVNHLRSDARDVVSRR